MRNLKDNKNNIVSAFLDEDSINALNTFISGNDSKAVASAAVIASLFCDGREFSALLGKDSTEKTTAEEKLINSFHNNLRLLVQKTWVEKSDEALKDQVLDRLNTLCEKVLKGEYNSSYQSFITILYDVVYLMFGAQAKKEDFCEYALRIDPGFGIFWWYVESLPTESTFSEVKSRIALLLGMYFLANY